MTRDAKYGRLLLAIETCTRNFISDSFDRMSAEDKAVWGLVPVEPVVSEGEFMASLLIRAFCKRMVRQLLSSNSCCVGEASATLAFLGLQERSEATADQRHTSIAGPAIAPWRRPAGRRRV